MTTKEINRAVAVNIAYWTVAVLAQPLINLFPTASGSPAKIFELLVPLFLISLGAGSTYLLKQTAGKPKD